MRIIILCIIIFLSFMAILSLHVDADERLIPDIIETPAKKILFTDWIKDATLKYSFVSTFCTKQAVTGLVESSKFSGNKIVAEDDYHIYRTLEDITGLGAGWLGYALYRNKRMTKWQKIRIVFGAACVGRNLREMMYRANRTGNMFCYSGDYTFNDKALVLIKWDGEKRKFIDFYIHGRGKQGMYIDLAFWGGAVYAFSSELRSAIKQLSL